MKKISYIMIGLLISSIFLVGCDDLLTSDSERQATDSEFGTASNDILYATFGILSQVQKLADGYVLLGELRGELLNTSELSDQNLRDINDFNIGSNNPYADIRDYYAVINNCNYILQKIDSAKLDNGLKINMGIFAAIKSIRAWTYIQIALNFKTAKYYEDPILTIADSKKDYPEYNLQQLSDVLIAELEPLKEVDFSIISGFSNGELSYFPIRFLLGDMYLWKGDYQKAATEYYDLMLKNWLTVNKAYSSSWQVVNNTISLTQSPSFSWNSSFLPGSTEVISSIVCPTQYGQHFELDSLNSQRKIVPSNIAIINWLKQTYYLNEASNAQMDLRINGSIMMRSSAINNSNNTSQTGTMYTANDSYMIYKYRAYRQNIPVYRTSLLYLRYAEAVNRLHKPNLAFAVLKYGLSSTTMYNSKIIPAREKDSISAAYMNFSDSRFSANVGTRMRGLGNADKDTTFFVFQRQNTMKDSILYVENLILQELALETAFEGNRFHDLMRITLRRMENGEGDASYLANLIAPKHIGSEVAIKQKLMNVENWYIKK